MVRSLVCDYPTNIGIGPAERHEATARLSRAPEPSCTRFTSDERRSPPRYLQPVRTQRVYIRASHRVLCYRRGGLRRLVRVGDNHEGDTRWDGIGTLIARDRLTTHLHHGLDGDRISIRLPRIRHLRKRRLKPNPATLRRPVSRPRHRPLSTPLVKANPPTASRHPRKPLLMLRLPAPFQPRKSRHL